MIRPAGDTGGSDELLRRHVAGHHELGGQSAPTLRPGGLTRVVRVDPVVGRRVGDEVLDARAGRDPFAWSEYQSVRPTRAIVPAAKSNVPSVCSPHPVTSDTMRGTRPPARRARNVTVASPLVVASPMSGVVCRPASIVGDRRLERGDGAVGPKVSGPSNSADRQHAGRDEHTECGNDDEGRVAAQEAPPGDWTPARTPRRGPGRAPLQYPHPLMRLQP